MYLDGRGEVGVGGGGPREACYWAGWEHSGVSPRGSPAQ